mmetsp:Transcript_26342/g.52888  ORF Transcript_26342/g.52888 Transcript_26342/m.52888 type:complete len:239 (-) Transcript_26342:141-857(-)
MLNALSLAVACAAYARPTIPHIAYSPSSYPARSKVIASAKIIPAANIGLGGAMLFRAASPGPLPARAVLASTGLLAVFNLAVTDNQRYVGAKRAFARVEDLPPGQMGLAKRWYDCVRIQVFGQLLGMLWMLCASPTAGAVIFMATNMIFFLKGAAEAKHDSDGLPAPFEPSPVKNIARITDGVLLVAAVNAAAAPTAVLRAAGAFLFSALCLVGALEGILRAALVFRVRHFRIFGRTS